MIHTISSYIKKLAKEEGIEDPGIQPSDPGMEPAQPPMEEKDQDTLLQEHVKNNIDKYKTAFEAYMPTTQMIVSNVEYHGEVTKDKIRVLVEFQTPMINFDGLKVLAEKEVGVEAIGEKTFRVYNIYLPKVKDTTIKN